MSPRASWRGFIRISALSCPVALYAASSSAERVSFHMVNRKTGNRLQRHFVDSDSGKPVDAADQVKGYEVATDEYVTLDPAEIAAAVPESDKTLTVKAFVPCNGIDEIYLDRPYYLAPADPTAAEAFTLIRDALTRERVAALAEAVLFRRFRTLLIRPHDRGLIAETLNPDYEVRTPAEAFDEIPDVTTSDEMLDLARHIIKTKMGDFDITAFDDRYDAALAELVKAKIAGKKITRPPQASEAQVIDLMTALRESAGAKAAKPAAKKVQRAQKPASRKSPAKPAGRKSG